MKYLLAALVGVLTSIAWNWWAVAVSRRNVFQVCVSDFMIIACAAINVSYIAQQRYAEFMCFAVAGALSSGAVVALLGRKSIE